MTTQFHVALASKPIGLGLARELINEVNGSAIFEKSKFELKVDRSNAICTIN